MPKFYITEHCNELRVYTYEVEAETREAANTLYINGYCWLQLLLQLLLLKLLLLLQLLLLLFRDSWRGLGTPNS